jgi:SOS-response transcriptional repressor LexA
MLNRPVELPSPKQMELLCRLYQFQHKYGYSPTLDELGQMMGISKVTVHQYIHALEQKGLVRRFKNYARSLQIVDESKIKPYMPTEQPSWKLVGRLGISGQIKFYSSPKKLEPEILFERYRSANLLRVMGCSWPDKNICDGDYLLIEPLNDKHCKNLVLVQTPSGRVEICNLIRRQDQLLIKNDIAEETPTHCGDILAVIIGLLRGY